MPCDKSSGNAGGKSRPVPAPRDRPSHRTRLESTCAPQCMYPGIPCLLAGPKGRRLVKRNVKAGGGLEFLIGILWLNGLIHQTAPCREIAAFRAHCAEGVRQGS